jgi:hypothetical protein
MDWTTEAERNHEPDRHSYTTTLHHTDKHHPCLVPDCPHRKIPSATAMRTHFMYKHPKCCLTITNESSLPLPKCPLCDMHVTYQALNTTHQHSKICDKGAARKTRRKQLAARRRAQEIEIMIHCQSLDKVSQFKYLGRIMSQNNSDWPAVHRNIKKALRKWAMIARPLLRTGVAPKVVVMFYKAIVQAVLLYACETWVVTPKILKALQAFHNRMARKIANCWMTKTYFGTACPNQISLF